MKSIQDIFGSNSYKTQLQSDQWKAFTKDVRSSRNFCECCRQSGLELQVHHLFYDFNRKLWEYSQEDVIVLCSDCHDQIHEQLKQFRKYVFRHLNGQSFRVLNGALAVALTKYDPMVFTHALAEFVSNANLVENHARAWAESTPEASS